MPKTTLAIVGSHPATRENVPWDNPAVDILVFNEAGAQEWVRRWDITLQLHTQTIYRNPHNRTDPAHWQWLQKDHGKEHTIYMQDRDGQVPNSKKFPRKEINDTLLRGLTIATPDGLEHPEPFTNSISFALALGIYLGYRRILLFGTEMASNTEYAYQRENFLLWLGIAAGRGVRLELHSGQSMVTGPVYGYDGDLTYSPAAFDAGIKEHDKELKKAWARLKDCEQQLTLADPTNSNELARLMSQAADANYHVGHAAGSKCIARRYSIKAHAMTNETGRALISRQEFEQGAAAAWEYSNKIIEKVTRLDGKLEEYYRTFKATGDPRAMQAFAQIARQQHRLMRIFGVFRGRHEANTVLMLEADKRLKAAGGEKSLDAYKVKLSAPIQAQAVNA